MSISQDEVINYLSNLTVIDLVNLTKALEDKWGVKAAPVAVAAAPGAGGGAAPAAAAESAQTEFTVVLEGLADASKGAGAAAAPDGGSLQPMLRTNVYQGGAPTDRQLATLGRALAEQDRALARQEGAALLAGMIVWIEPEKMLNA